jgi:single-strand DNA-binding protein
MLNQCNFIGRTGKEIDLKYTPSGDAVATVSIAVSESWKDKNGDKKQKTEWVNVVAWRKLAEIMSSYVKKGDLIYISGKLTTRSYDDRDGNKRYVTEVVADTMQMLGSKDDRGSQGKPAAPGTSSRPYGTPQPHHTEDDSLFDPDSEIPF